MHEWKDTRLVRSMETVAIMYVTASHSDLTSLLGILGSCHCSTIQPSQTGLSRTEEEEEKLDDGERLLLHGRGWKALQARPL